MHHCKKRSLFRDFSHEMYMDADLAVFRHIACKEVLHGDTDSNLTSVDFSES